ncbi:alcohol dehydrogenase catalytic domain-containing protein [Oryzobacter sp. R7]|uniref:alcohol dehydrogenase catalytic domain-containing protein n=1 Tax=Oryzobacter faecalis TaxID=3388656 RepID=UPI00398D638E
MRALTYNAFGATPVVAEVPDPVAPAGGAVVRVLASGLCRSDWHGWTGHDPDIATFPHVPGHELAGVVESVGAGVDAAWVGRRVTAPFVMACGVCPVCRGGDGQVCPDQRQPGFTDPGSFAELVVVHAAATNLVPLPDGLAVEAAAGLGCRVATAYRAVVHRSRVEGGEHVLVIGCGGVGLAAVAVARARGALVCAVDVSADSLERALANGADEVVDASIGVDRVVEAVRHWSGGAGVRVGIDALGSPDACRTSILALARRGRHVQVGLLPPAAGAAAVPMERVIGWELDVLGSHGMAAADYPALLDDVVSGRLRLDDLLAPDTEPLSLEEAGAALVAMGDAPSRGILVVDPTR